MDGERFINAERGLLEAQLLLCLSWTCTDYPHDVMYFTPLNFNCRKSRMNIGAVEMNINVKRLTFTVDWLNGFFSLVFM